MEESFWNKQPFRIAVFFGIGIVLVLVWILSSQSQESSPAPTPSGSAAPPTRPAPIEPTQSTSPDRDPGTVGERVETYLKEYQQFTWDTDVEEWRDRLVAIGADGDALIPPFSGDSLATCVRIQCGYTNVEVENVQQQDNGTWSGEVTSTFRQVGKEPTRGTLACTVRTLNGLIVESTCLGLA